MASKRVLIVDDEENIGRSLRMILEREGYAVNVCQSVAEFRRHPDAQRADAYLFDMKLPDGSGIDLLRAVKQNGAPSPAIMISGPRHHRRRGGGDARRSLRFSGKAAEPRPRAAGGEERAWSRPRCGRRTSACASWWAARRKMIGIEPGVACAPWSRRPWRRGRMRACC